MCMSKIKVTPSGSWELKDGSTVEYYDVGQWNKELDPKQICSEMQDAKHAIAVHKAWYKFLKKQRKNRTDTTS